MDFMLPWTRNNRTGQGGFLDPHNLFRGRDAPNPEQNANANGAGDAVAAGQNVPMRPDANPNSPATMRGNRSNMDHEPNASFRGMGNGNTNNNNQLEYTEDSSYSTSSPLQSTLDELNMSILPHDVRLSAILKASQLFDHRDRTKHDYELHEGAARIIYQKLAFVLALQLSSYDSVSSYNMKVQTSGYSEATGGGIDGTGHKTGGIDAHASGHGGNAGSGNSVASNSNTTSIASMQRMRSTRSAQASDADYEISLLTACLEMVHRASNGAIAHTWHSIGMEALPILVKMIERPFHKIQTVLKRAAQLNHSANIVERNIAQACNRENKIVVQKVTKILAVYSLIPEAKIAMTNCPGLLSILVKITDTHNLNRMKGGAGSMRPVTKRMLNKNAELPITDDPSIEFQTATGGNGIQGSSAGLGLYMTEAARFNAIAILTNLAAVEHNRMTMLSEPGLVDNIARVVHNERSDVARQCSALAIMNLTYGDREHVPELAGNELILETIIKLIKDDDPETRRNAAIALFNVACADLNTIKLVRYKGGIILEVLLHCINPDDTNGGAESRPMMRRNSTSSNIETANDEVSTNAAEALFNISCSSIEETTNRLAEHPGLLETLAMTMRSPVASREVKLYCAATLRRMGEIIHAPRKSQLEFLSALVKASMWTRTTCIAEAFLSQAKVSSNRAIMVEHHGLLSALSKQALAVGGVDCDKIRSVAVSAIEHLSRESSNRQHLSQHEGIMLAMTRASYLSNQIQTNRNGGPSGPGPDGNNGAQRQMSGMSDDDSTGSTPTIVNRRLQMALKHLVGAM
jgi:hypothetical protein